MKIIITENQFKKIHEQLDFIDNTKQRLTNIFKSIKNIFQGHFDMYKNVIPGIADKYYGKNNIKNDAFRHILASAFFTTTIGKKLTYFGGEVNEILGALRNFLKGEGFDSGWEMDSLNNKIGIELGKKNINSDIDSLSSKVKKIVDSGDFYTQNKILYKNDKNPKF